MSGITPGAHVRLLAGVVDVHDAGSHGPGAGRAVGPVLIGVRGPVELPGVVRQAAIPLPVLLGGPIRGEDWGHVTGSPPITAHLNAGVVWLAHPRRGDQPLGPQPQQDQTANTTTNKISLCTFNI